MQIGRQSSMFARIQERTIIFSGRIHRWVRSQATPQTADRSVASNKAKANCAVFSNAPARATVRTKNYPTRPQDDKKFSFTACPNSHTARPHARADFSHSSFETRKITEDNGKLCKRLMEISTTNTGQFANNMCSGGGASAGKIPANMAAAAVNRRKSETKIAQENLAIYKRLQAIKPSKDISRNTLGKDFEKSRGYMNNARKLPDGGVAAARKLPEPGHTTATASVLASPARKPAAAPMEASPPPPRQAEPQAAAVTGEDVPEARPSAEAATVPEAAVPPPEPAPAPPADDDDAVEEEDIGEEV